MGVFIKTQGFHGICNNLLFIVTMTVMMIQITTFLKGDIDDDDVIRTGFSVPPTCSFAHYKFMDGTLV